MNTFWDGLVGIGNTWLEGRAAENVARLNRDAVRAQHPAPATGSISQKTWLMIGGGIALLVGLAFLIKR